MKTKITIWIICVNVIAIIILGLYLATLYSEEFKMIFEFIGLILAIGALAYCITEFIVDKFKLYEELNYEQRNKN